MKSTEPAVAEVPFDKFTMAPRNRRELVEAIAYQAEQIEGTERGFAVPHAYITSATSFMGPIKCLEMLYQCAPPDRFKVYFDGRIDAFLIEDYPQPKPAKKSALILPGHA